MDKKLGVTQDYDRSNYDSERAKKAYKEKTFGDHAVIIDPTTGKLLHKSQTNAQKKYHMKNADGENVSKKWATHSAETDHIHSLKSIHEKTKRNPFLSDEDIREIANCDANLRILPKSLNASKGEQSDFAVITDVNNGLSLKGRMHLAGEKIESDVVLTSKFTTHTAKNIGNLTVDSAKKSVSNNKIIVVRYGIEHIVDIATGKESLEDTAVDVGTFAVKTVGKDVIKDITDAAAINNPLVKYGAEHLVNVATGKESLEDAAVDVGTFAVKTVGKDVIKDITDAAAINNPLVKYGAEHLVNVATGKESLEDAAVDVGTFAVKTVGKDVIKDITDAAAINNPLVKYGAEHLVNVATGKESLEDAAVDVGTFAVKTVGKDAIKNITDTALINNPLYQSLKSGGKLGELIQVGTMVAESACRLIDGDITAEEFMLEIGDKGATMLAQMAGGEVGAIVGEIIGISVGGFLGAGAGAVIGKAIGTMIATVACNVIIAIKKNLISNFKSLDDYKLQEKAIHKLETEAIAEMEYQRQKFREIVENEYKKWDENIEAGFNQIMYSACQEVYDLQGITDGLDKILSVFGKSVLFKNINEYKSQLDMPLKLNF